MNRSIAISLISGGILSLIMAPAWGDCLTESVCGFTHQQLDGNRFITGTGSFIDQDPIEISLDHPADWVVAVPADQGAIWVTVLADGSVQGYRSRGARVEPVDVDLPQVSLGQPPLLQMDPQGISVVSGDDPDASDLTHALLIPQGMLWISKSGDLRLGSQQISAQALPDARLISDGSDRYWVLAGADDQRYRHGVLGDRIEATRLLQISTVPELRSVLSVELDPAEVIEGIAPIWVDWDGRPGREVIVTLSDAEFGGQIGVFDERGRELGRGPGFGQGNRWRHPIAVASFGPEGERELAVVRTPHIGGVVEFYGWPDLGSEGSLDTQLPIVATQAGFTSHGIGSRNLDMGLAGDLNGDGQPEIVLPTKDRRFLGGIQRTPEGAEVIWTVPLAGELTTNLAAVSTPDQQILLGVGTQDRLQLWLGE